jgi:hypothetical protein
MKPGNVSTSWMTFEPVTNVIAIVHLLVEEDRHELAPGELGQHPGVDAVGLTGKRRQPLHLDGVGDLDLPAVQLELVVHEAGTGHRLDRRSQGLPMTRNADGQSTQTVTVGCSRPISTVSPTSSNR